MAIEVADGRLKLKRELEAGWFQWVELPLPAVITIQSGINKPRYATLKGIMAAKKKEIATVDRASLGVPDAPTQHIERIYVPQKTKKTEFITGSPKEIAAKLIEKLRHEARVHLAMKILLITEQREGQVEQGQLRDSGGGAADRPAGQGHRSPAWSSAKALRRWRTISPAISSTKCCSSSTTCSRNTRPTVFRSRCGR